MAAVALADLLQMGVRGVVIISGLLAITCIWAVVFSRIAEALTERFADQGGR